MIKINKEAAASYAGSSDQHRKRLKNYDENFLIASFYI